MKLFICMLLQVLLFVPLTSFAADGGLNPITQNHGATEVTEAGKTEVVKTYGNLPLYFIKNNGQVDEEVTFYERGAGHATSFTKDGVVLSLTKRYDRAGEPSFNELILGLKPVKSAGPTTEAVSLSFVGADKKADIVASRKQGGHVNYFAGNDKSEWRTNIPTYGAVTYKDVYKNIDIKFYGNNSNIEHDVIVRPGGDFSEVIFAYKGIKGLKVTDAGDLEISLQQGKLIEKKPLIYQEIKGERITVTGAYRVFEEKDGAFSYGFNVASYDHSKDLVIDPVLIWSTYLGGINDDLGVDIAVDSTGATYVVGTILPPLAKVPAFNLLPGVIGGGADIFVTKIDPAGSAFVYSTFFGGSADERGRAIAVDSAGVAYVTGQTSSTDFPLMNPIQVALLGLSDAFVTELNPAGTALVYSSYLGGSGGDNGNGIAVDSAGSIYVTGQTTSTDFPLFNPVQVALLGLSDAFVTEINPAGTALVFSSYLGGSSFDSANSIVVDSAGVAYVTGQTSSTDFPLMNPIQVAFGGSSDAFVTKINCFIGTPLVYSTYLGGSNNDIGNEIAIDSVGSAYVTGNTSSTDFPLMNPVQGVYGGASSDAFVTEINPAGTALVYSTYLGGSGIDGGNGIAVDSAGVAHVTGNTSSTDFPLINPIQTPLNGFIDAFVTKINSTGTAFVYSTYLGGGGDDFGQAIALDNVGAAYLTGFTRSTDFPLMLPIQGVSGGGSDTFITKISAPPLKLTITPDAVSVPRIVGGATLGYNVTATNTTATQQCFQYWENVTMPDTSTFPTTGELFGPINLCLAAGASRTNHLSHRVRKASPTGLYTFNAFVGTNPTPVKNVARFNFTVTP